MDRHGGGIRAIAFGEHYQIISDGVHGAAWLSQLYELKEILSRIGTDTCAEEDVLAMRPHKFFDIFTGTGLGGVFVVLFTRLRMTLGDVIQFCRVLQDHLFYSTSWIEQDMVECNKIFEALLLEQLGNFSLDDPLDVKDSPKGFVCVVNIEYPSQPRFLRTYKVRSNFGPGCTIRQALRTTLADGVHLPPISIQHATAIFMAGSIRFCNPTLLLMKELVAAFSVVENAACITNLGAGYAGSHTSLSTANADPLKASIYDCEAVAEHVRELSRDLGSFFVRISVNHLPEDLSQTIDSLGRIIAVTEAHLCTNDVSMQVDDVVAAIVKRPTIVALSRLVSLAGVDAKSHLHSTIDQIASVSSWTYLRKILNPNTPISNIAQEHAPCVPNTCHTVLNTIRSWIHDPQATNVRLLRALPGAGKSTVATSLAHELVTAGLLGAQFFCRRSEAAMHTPRILWRLIALDLCKHSSFSKALAAEFKGTTPNLDSLPINELFDMIIARPLKAMDNDKVIVVVIDALDEFGEQTADSLAHRSDFLDTISSWKNLPHHCRLFITSRTGNGIEKMLGLDESSLFTLQVGTVESFHDIQQYYRQRFSGISITHPHLPEHWPSDADIDLLVERAAGLFIWASTFVKVVLSRVHDPPGLKSLLSQIQRGVSDLDALYLMILETAFPQHSSTYLLTSVIGAVLYANIPLSQTALCLLFGFDKAEVANICTVLQPVMDLTTNLTFIHQSFVDFIQSRTCPDRFRSKSSTQTDMLEHCLATINSSQLHFNMGKLQSSLHANKDMSALCESVPEHVRYSCLAWAAHLNYAEDSALQAMLGDFLVFLQEKLLFWLEIMCIEDSVGEAARSLTILILHPEIRKATPRLMETIRDALTFTRTLVTPIADYYPHIYISALPFVPKTSLIRQNYSPKFRNTMEVESPLDSWSPEQGCLRGHNGPVRAVAFSPDGRLVASGSKDHSVRLWNSETGKPVGSPLLGHMGPVTSIAFSHNGQWLASGSADLTVRRWDVVTGDEITPPLSTTNKITSVAISPNGQHVLASSVDGKVRRWDAKTGLQAATPLSRVQESWISRITTMDKYRVITFSHDTHRVASAAASTNFHIWDGKTGRTIAKTDRVFLPIYAAAFSADGRRLASASGIAPSSEIATNASTRATNTIMKGVKAPRTFSHADAKSLAGDMLKFGFHGDILISAEIPLLSRLPTYSLALKGTNSIHLWDAETGESIGEPLHGHRGPVRSVAFSLDSSRMVSGSTDCTIRLWNAKTGSTLGTPLIGHRGTIRAVAFSPDGQRLVSGSEDGTIRLWDANTGGVNNSSHNKKVWSVVFNTNGSHVISASDDSVVRHWDAETGAPVSDALPLLPGAFGISYLAQMKRHPTKPILSPDGRRYVLAVLEREVVFWNLEAYTFHFNAFSPDVWACCFAFSSDSSYIVAGFKDSKIRYYDGKTGAFIEEIRSSHKDPITSIVISPNNRFFASGSQDGTVQIWDTSNNTPFGGPVPGHTSAVLALSFSFDGIRLASGSEDGTIQLWDIMSGEKLNSLCGHTDTVSSLAFAPTCHLLASGSFDKTVRLWDGAIGAPIGDPRQAHTERITCLAFSPDGRRLASGSWDERVRIWDTSQVNVRKNASGTLRDDVVFSVLTRYPAALSTAFLTTSGWVLNDDDEPLVFIPTADRESIQPLHGIAILGSPRPMVRLDFSKFKYGDDWEQCYTPEAATER